MSAANPIVQPIALVLDNLTTVLFIVALVVAFAKVRRAQLGRRVVTWHYLVWGELLFYAVGLSLVYLGLLHAFAQTVAAGSTGWDPSPFEWELAWAQIGLGAVGVLSLWRGFNTRLTVTIVFAILSFGAAAQHLNQIVCCRNFTAGNAGLVLWLGQIVLPALLLVLAFLSRDAYERKVRW